ncbi:DNA and RNA helicase [Sporosarcina limicola]|uniref:DNA and RNA helicase n=1 Tax=Sporosarcina limicola TaxID=34101 RepID=A0A927RE38_9BACL|nr:DNA and RNA helicase [Sporosarcina limicola]MBE1555945.1 hypothetical protein [Sporosarcina limicola]
MFYNIYPHFQKGRILKREMLENLRDYPRNVTDSYFQDYSDGIIVGGHILVEETTLVITKGMVKHDGRVYMLDADYLLPYQAIGRETLLKIRFQEERDQHDFTSFTTEIILDDLVQVAENELELGRFKLKLGARLRSTYEDFLDFATEYNTVNYIHCQYAGFQTSTFHPLILQYFAKELLRCEPSNPYDISFALQCLNQERIQREVIYYYLCSKLGIGYQEYTNEKIHTYLSRILREAKGGNRPRSELNIGRPQRVIVD